MDSISNNFGRRADVRALLNIEKFPPNIFLLLSSADIKPEDTVRCRAGSCLLRLVGVLVTAMALCILTFRTAFFQSCLPRVGEFGEVIELGELGEVNSTSAGEWCGVGGMRGDTGVDGSLITAVTSEGLPDAGLVGSRFGPCSIVVGNVLDSKSSLSCPPPL